MNIFFCDTCGIPSEKSHPIHIPVGADSIIRCGTTLYGQLVDGKWSNVMGRTDTINVCIECLSKIEVNNLQFINKLKDENKEKIAISAKLITDNIRN